MPRTSAPKPVLEAIRANKSLGNRVYSSPEAAAKAYALSTAKKAEKERRLRSQTAQANPALRKQVFLPEFTIALVRTPYLSARYAQFRVPLDFNKLDMRDYLKRGYGVNTLAIRSYIEQKPITRITRDGRNLGQWRRPKSEKRMTVELAEPFVWPEEPKDLSPWEKESWDTAAKYQEKAQKENRQKGDSSEEPNYELREAYKKQAEELKENKSEWRPTWKALGMDFAHKELRKGSASRTPLPKYLGGGRR